MTLWQGHSEYLLRRTSESILLPALLHHHYIAHLPCSVCQEHPRQTPSNSLASRASRVRESTSSAVAAGRPPSLACPDRGCVAACLSGAPEPSGTLAVSCSSEPRRYTHSVPRPRLWFVKSLTSGSVPLAHGPSVPRPSVPWHTHRQYLVFRLGMPRSGSSPRINRSPSYPGTGPGAAVRV